MTLVLIIAPALALTVFALIGYLRDIRRAVVALAGTLLGASIVDFWADRWGKALAAWFGSTNPDSLTLLASVLPFVATVLFVGYGGGLLLGISKERPTFSQRLAGALLGLLNGALIVAYLLRYLAMGNAERAATFNSSPITHYLYEGLPYLFLAITVPIGLLAMLRGLVGLTQLRQPASSRPSSTPTPQKSPAPIGEASRPAAGQQAQQDQKIAEKIGQRIGH